MRIKYAPLKLSVAVSSSSADTAAPAKELNKLRHQHVSRFNTDRSVASEVNTLTRTSNVFKAVSVRWCTNVEDERENAVAALCTSQSAPAHSMQYGCSNNWTMWDCKGTRRQESPEDNTHTLSITSEHWLKWCKLDYATNVGDASTTPRQPKLRNCLKLRAIENQCKHTS